MKKEVKKSNIVGIELWEFLRQSFALNSVECFQLFISLLYLRRMDCLLKPYYVTIRNAFAHSIVDEDTISDLTDGLTYYNVSGFSIDDILHQTQFDSSNPAVDIWINGFDNKTREILAGLSFDKYIAIIKKEQFIYPVFHFLSGINLENELSLDSIKDIYSLIASNNYGGFASPESYGKYISAYLFYGVGAKEGIKIYDPVCGTSIMLQEVESEAGKKYLSDDIECYGSELNLNVYSVSIVLTVLAGKTYYHLSCQNSLINSFDYLQFDFIVADLPIGGRFSTSELQEINLVNFYTDGCSVKSVPETYFMQMIMKNLKWNGRAAVITPAKLLSDSQSDSFRTWLLSKDYVETIVRLPKDKFQSSVDRYAWILAKNKDDKFRDFIRLVDMQSMNDPECDIYSNIDNIYNGTVFVEFADNYSHICELDSFSVLKVQLLNKKTGKIAETTIKSEGEHELMLRSQGFVTTDFGGDWEILYDKTTRSYSIPFNEYFDEDDARYLTSNEMHSEFAPDFARATNALSVIADLNLPERREMKHPKISSWAGEIPSSWRPITVQELYVCTPAYREDKPFKGGESPLLNVRYLRGEADAVDYTALKEKSVIVEDDDLVIIRSGANAGEVLKGKKGVLGSTLFRMRFNQENCNIANRHFAKFMLVAMSDYFKSFNTSTSIGSVTAKAINTAVAYLPSLEEQQKIVDFLQPVYNNTEDIQKSLGVVIPKLKLFRDSLVFDAVTGKFKL